MSQDFLCTYMNEDLQILEYLNSSKLRGIRLLFSRYGEGMVIVAYRMLGDIQKAKEVVDDTFWKLWSEQGFSDATPPLRLFLYEKIKKACEKDSR
jgi:DNA-directed RNA polymerase specialized sigma24 family protein